MKDRESRIDWFRKWASVAICAYAAVAIVVLVATKGRVVLLRPW